MNVFTFSQKIFLSVFQVSFILNSVDSAKIWIKYINKCNNDMSSSVGIVFSMLFLVLSCTNSQNKQLWSILTIPFLYTFRIIKVRNFCRAEKPIMYNALTVIASIISKTNMSSAPKLLLITEMQYVQA